MASKIVKFLSSLRFTIVLICLLGVMFIVGLWVPQRRLLKAIYLQWQKSSPDLVAFLDFLGLTNVYASPITITLWLLFFVNLALVLWQRMPVVRYRIAISEEKIADPEQSPGYPYKSSFPIPDGVEGEALLASLRRRRYRVLGDPSGFYAVKNRLAPVAFILFHVSFYLILLGGLISVYTEFIGYVDLAQGESFRGEVERYNSSQPMKMPKIGAPPVVPITVESVVPKVVHNTPTGISVMLKDDKGSPHEVGINVPYADGPTSYVFNHLGMAPHFLLRDSSGQLLENARVKLDVLKMRPDKFAFADYSFTATFYPDFVMENGKRATRSMEFNNPVFFVKVEKGGREIAQGLVPRNGALQFDGKRLEMQDLSYWVRFYVITQRGLPILYFGFAVACVAVIWRMIFYKRELLGRVRDEGEGRTLLVAGRSEYYKSLAEDEFDALLARVTGAGSGS